MPILLDGSIVGLSGDSLPQQLKAGVGSPPATVKSDSRHARFQVTLQGESPPLVTEGQRPHRPKANREEKGLGEIFEYPDGERNLTLAKLRR